MTSLLKTSETTFKFLFHALAIELELAFHVDVFLKWGGHNKLGTLPIIFKSALLIRDTKERYEISRFPRYTTHLLKIIAG